MTLACPECGSQRNDVKDSRHAERNGFAGPYIRRRRRCRNCHERFTTYEIGGARFEALEMLFQTLAPLRDLIDQWSSDIETAKATLTDEDETVENPRA